MVVEPPAASIFCFAEAENAWALTWTATSISPWPSTLTRWPLRTAPLATSSSTVMLPPSGKSSPMRSRLTTWYSSRKGFLKPFSLGRRMCRGSWPPSKYAGMLLRALEPLVPRPAVLPLDPSPRPTRVLAVLAPGAGRRWCSLSVMSVHLFDDDQVPDRLEHPTDLGTVLLDDDVADALETKRPEGVPLVLLAADRRPLLLDLEACHYWATSARARSRAAGATSSTGRPRRAATASGSSSERSASTVACTMLIW